jgi:hypothetical protein
LKALADQGDDFDAPSWFKVCRHRLTQSAHKVVALHAQHAQVVIRLRKATQKSRFGGGLNFF